jgi:hypothetical protein
MQREILEPVALLQPALVREACFADIDAHDRGVPVVERQPGRGIRPAARDQDANVLARRTLRPIGAAEKERIGEIAQLARREVFYRLRIDPALVLRPDLVVMQDC